MDNSTPEKLIKRLTSNTYTDQDAKELNDWLKTASIEQIEEVLDRYGDFFKNLDNTITGEYSSLFQKIENRINLIEQNSAPRPMWPNFRQAAGAGLILLILVVGAGLAFWRMSASSAQSSFSINKPVKILPGGNKAILTLANGSKVMLDNVQNGVVAHEGNTTIEKSDNGRLSYSINNAGVNETAGHNIVSTPLGGEYRLVLPDGSKVWLNAGSSLKFPTAFTGNERRVELKGEAYFEVSKNKKMPFRVMAGVTEVEVLGTHFNVSAYKDEQSREVTTTLLEGSVRVIKGAESRVIRPGQKAIVNKTINVKRVNASEAIEWKNGNFNFSNESIQSIMQKISRWYDVEVEYQGNVTTEGFVGTIQRSTDIKEVLERLELTGLVHFKIVERRIIVMP